MAKFKVGDEVQLVIKEGSEPEFGWGDVGNGAVGIVGEFTDGVVYVDFPEHENWMGDPAELKLLSHKVKSEPAVNFSVGANVKLVIKEGSKPEFGWGDVENGDQGIIKGIYDDDTIIVDFPAQDGWKANPSELALIPKVKTGTKGKSLKTKKLYAVYHKDSLSDPILITQDRDFAREVKAGEGGKASGWIILKYEATKEIR